LRAVRHHDRAQLRHAEDARHLWNQGPEDFLVFCVTKSALARLSGSAAHPAGTELQY
jgi:hypothetical protein